MPRVKAAVIRRDDATINDVPSLQLRVRSSAGTKGLSGLTGRSALSDLKASAEEALGGKLASLSFRGDAGNIVLLSEGHYPAMGALLVGPESRLEDMGITNQVCFNATVDMPPAKKRAPNPTQSQNSGSGKRAKKCSPAPSLLSPSLSLFSSSSSSSSSLISMDSVAMQFVHASGNQDEAMTGSRLASHFFTAADGTKRAEAAVKGLVEISDVGKGRIDVEFRLSAGGALSTEQVRRLTSEDCVEVVARIIFRSAGSKRRRVAMLPRNGGQGPSLALFTPEAIATRCPELFWALYDNSR